MIERLHRIATVLGRYQPWILVAATLCLMVVFASVIENPWLVSDEWLMPAIAGLLWLLLLYSLSTLFQSIPEAIEPGMGWRKRMSLKIRHSGLWLLGALFLVLSVAVLLLSYQLLRVAFF